MNIQKAERIIADGIANGDHPKTIAMKVAPQTDANAWEPAKTTNAQHLAVEICELLHGPAEEGDEAFSRDVSEVAELLARRSVATPPSIQAGSANPGTHRMEHLHDEDRLISIYRIG